MPDAQADDDVDLGLLVVEQPGLEDRIADRLVRALLHLQCIGNADRGLVHRADLAEHGVRPQAMRLQDLDEEPRFFDQADARRDADLLRADAVGEGIQRIWVKISRIIGLERIELSLQGCDPCSLPLTYRPF